MTSATRTGFWILLTIVLICNVKPYDLKIRNVYRIPSSEQVQATRGDTLELNKERGSGEDVASFLSEENSAVSVRNGNKYQKEDINDYRPSQFMKTKNKEERKRGIQALAKNADFPKKIASRGLTDVFVTNYTFPSEKHYPY